MKREDLIVLSRTCGIEPGETDDRLLSLLASHELTGFAREYFEFLMPRETSFVSQIYLWNPRRTIGELRTPESLPSVLLQFGYVPFGSSMAADFICVKLDSNEVYWINSVFFIGALNKIILKSHDGEILEDPSPDALGHVLLYLTSFDARFVESLILGKYAGLFQVLGRNVIVG